MELIRILSNNITMSIKKLLHELVVTQLYKLVTTVKQQWQLEKL